MIERHFVNDAAPYIDAEFLNSLVDAVNSLITNSIRKANVSASSEPSNYYITVDEYVSYNDYKDKHGQDDSLIVMTFIPNVMNSASCTISWGDITYEVSDVSTGALIGANQMKVGAPSLLTFDGARFWYMGDSNCTPVTKRVVIENSVATVNLVDNTEYRFSSPVTDLTITFPDSSFESWMLFTAGDSIVVKFPQYTRYANKAPVFIAGATYEISVKDYIVVVAEVVS